jgi:hypothetical protein
VCLPRCRPSAIGASFAKNPNRLQSLALIQRAFSMFASPRVRLLHVGRARSRRSELTAPQRPRSRFTTPGHRRNADPRARHGARGRWLNASVECFDHAIVLGVAGPRCVLAGRRVLHELRDAHVDGTERIDYDTSALRGLTAGAAVSQIRTSHFHP